MKNITNEFLIKKALSAVNPKKSATGRLFGDVGAALVTDKGNIYCGTCFDTQEGNTLCAERSAMAAMITAGETKIKKIVAIWTNGEIIPPCGACREWLWQIDKDNWNTEVIIGKNKSITLKDLLPHHWHNLETKGKKLKIDIKELVHKINKEVFDEVNKRRNQS